MYLATLSLVDASIIEVYDASTFRHMGSLYGAEDIIGCLCLSWDSGMIACGCDDSFIVIWDLPEGTLKMRFTNDLSVCSICFNSFGDRLASMSDSLITIWDLEQQLPVQSFAHFGRFATMSHYSCWDSDAPLISVGTSPNNPTYDTALMVWDPTTGKEMACLDGHEIRIRCLAVSPTMGIAASGSDDGIIIIWDLHSYRQVVQIDAHEDAVEGISYCSDGSRLASATEQEAKIWDTSHWTAITTISFRNIDCELECFALSPDGTKILYSLCCTDLRVEHIIDDTPATANCLFANKNQNHNADQNNQKPHQDKVRLSLERARGCLCLSIASVILL
jgi:WD40 repeat protein